MDKFFVWSDVCEAIIQHPRCDDGLSFKRQLLWDQLSGRCAVSAVPYLKDVNITETWCGVSPCVRTCKSRDSFNVLGRKSALDGCHDFIVVEMIRVLTEK